MPYPNKHSAKLKDSNADFESADPDKNPCIFAQGGPVEFADDDQQEEKNRVRLKLYDGSVVKHWFWGNLAFELATMRMRRKTRNPILYSHDTNQRLAYSTSASFDGQFVLEGEFLKKSQKAAEIKQDIAEKFPFEASLRFDMDRSTIVLVKEGESVEVNGHQLKGPGALIKDAMIMEGSVCVFGALKNTKSVIFERANIMPETETKIESAAMFAEQYPKLHDEIVTAAKAEGMAEGVDKGQKEVRELFAEFAEKFGDDPALCVEQFKASATIEAAVAAQNEKLKAKNKELAEKSAQQQQTTTVDPAVQEFSDTQTEGQEQQNTNQTPEEKYTAEFNESADIRAEFRGDLVSYKAFRAAEDADRVKIAGQRS